MLCPSTAISMEEPSAVVTQEQIFENIHLHKEVLGSVKQQPLGMRRKLKIVHQAKGYIKRHEGQLQERLAQSSCTKDIGARFNIFINTKWQQLKREAANTSNLLIPWELRIKEIESHFGSVVASYFTFLRWLFWVNLVIAVVLLVFVIVPEYLTANPMQDGERKIIMEEERRNATNLLTLWEFEGVLKCSPIFYGYYSNIERPQYRMPLAYFLTGLVVYIYSFVATLRKMAENSRMSKLSEKEDECIFSWKLFTGWDFMIGNTETAHNRIASVILGFKEALLEEAEKKKDLRNWRTISLRTLVNICVTGLLVVSAYAVVTVVSRPDGLPAERSWSRENETTIVVTFISISFPLYFELLGYLEHYHPRKQLRLQLGRIMLLNLLNLFSLIFALFSKIEGMSKDLDSLKPTLSMNATVTPEVVLNISAAYTRSAPINCVETRIDCIPCNVAINIHYNIENTAVPYVAPTVANTYRPSVKNDKKPTKTVTKPTQVDLIVENLMDSRTESPLDTTTLNLIQRELNRLRMISGYDTTESNESSEEDFTSSEIFSNTNDYTDTTLTDIYTNYDQSTDSSENWSEIDTSTDFDETTSTEDTTFEEISTSLFSTPDSILISTNSESTESSMTTETTDLTETTDSYPKTTSTYDDTFTETTIETASILTKSTPSTTEGLFQTETPTIMTVLPSNEVVTDEVSFTNSITVCPDITFNCTLNCDGQNITHSYHVTNCSIVEKRCYVTKCQFDETELKRNYTNVTVIDTVYIDKNKRKMYNLTAATRKKLMKLCWETMFGQELVKLTVMDLVFVLFTTLFVDFFRALFVRYMNRCWCWDLEKRFPEYGDFKIAENILHLINNQGMVWMGMFFSPGLVVLNVFKLVIMMYLRSWTVMTCNVPHAVVFRVSKSNNFYLALLLTMLFLCVLPVGYTIVWVKPSWHCGPFSEYERIYKIITNNIYKILPRSLNFTLEYIASPAIVIPFLVLLILIIYYLTSLTNSLREANNDLKIQLRRERTEERRKMFQLADNRRKGGSLGMDNTPFARWKKALPTLPLSKSIDSDDRKTITADDSTEPQKMPKKKGGIFAKIVGMALDKKTNVDLVQEIIESSSPNNYDDETDTDFHESLPREVLKVKDITIVKSMEQRKKSNVEFKADAEKQRQESIENNLRVKVEKEGDRTEKKAVLEKQRQVTGKDEVEIRRFAVSKVAEPTVFDERKLDEKQPSESSTQSKHSDSIGSIIPVITISTTESDDELLEKKGWRKDKSKDSRDINKYESESSAASKVKGSDSKSLRRQSSVDSIQDNKPSKEKHLDDNGHKYQYSL